MSTCCIILGPVSGALQPDLPCDATTALDPKSKQVPSQSQKVNSFMTALFREGVHWLQVDSININQGLEKS